MSDFTSRLSVLQAAVSYWGRSARWRQSRFAWFFMEWIDAHIKGNECSTWNKACRATNQSHVDSPTPTVHIGPTARAKPSQSGGFLCPTGSFPPRFCGVFVNVSAILCWIGGVWHQQVGKIRFQLNSKQCSRQVRKIGFRLSLK